MMSETEHTTQQSLTEVNAIGFPVLKRPPTATVSAAEVYALLESEDSAVVEAVVDSFTPLRPFQGRQGDAHATGGVAR